jgi:uncharacterized membrane protein YphA (DoxX/SURF4 family)
MPSTDARGGLFLRIITGLLSLIFAVSGVIKLIPLESAVASFAAWGYPDWFRIAVGLAEFAGAILLLIPQVERIAAAGLSVMMVGAAITHLLTPGEAARALLPMILFLVLVAVVFADEARRARQSRGGAGRPGDPLHAPTGSR